MTVAQALSELLYEFDAVTVTGLGTFTCDYESAKVNVITNRFERPTATVVFDAQRREESDLLVRHLAVSDGIEVEEARQQVSRFMADCFAALKAGREVSLPGIGTLHPDPVQTVGFTPVASNFNGDAFGLRDFSPQPVYQGGSEVDWRAQVARQLKDQNTPMTVDTKAVHEDLGDEQAFDRRRRRRVLLIALSLLLLIPVVLLLLYFMEVIRFDLPSPPKPAPPVAVTRRVPPPDSAMQALLVRYDRMPVVETAEAAQDSVSDSSVADTAVSATPDTLSLASSPTPANATVPTTSATAVPSQPTATTSETAPSPTQATTPKPSVPTAASSPTDLSASSGTGRAILPIAEMQPYAIIAGCFSQQANAENYLKPILEQGYPEAFLMQKNGMFYVCYGQYATLDQAKSALTGIWANANPKAWILTK
ncbi:MAG: SPOR domain-containing protein [Bacteroidales bacterium]|nr:SPOR domain-containing protein [Bacteroidales bacterium]